MSDLTPQALKLTRNRWGFIAFMSVMCALSPFALSFPVPAFPNMGAAFGRDVAELQFLVSVYLVGLGAAQPIHGILADRIGRRPVLLFGFGLFTLASLASVLLPSWEMLIFCRFFQAVGVSAGTVISRTIVNDVQPREEAAISLSYISMAMGVGPIIAPILGGVLDQTLGWRAIYMGCALAGIVIWILALWRLPETRDARTARRPVLQNYKQLLTHRRFLGYTILFGAGQGIFFAFLPFAPDYFDRILGLSPAIFIASWIALSLAFIAGSWLGTRLTRRLGMDRSIQLATLWLVGAWIIMLSAYAVWGDTQLALVLPLMLAMLGTGLICPLALAGSISLDARLAGTAAGLSSAMGLVLGGMFTVVSGRIYDSTLWPFLGLAGIALAAHGLGVWLSRPVSLKTGAA